MSFKVPTHYIDEEYGLEHQMLFQTPLFTATLQEFDNRKLEKDIYELKKLIVVLVDPIKMDTIANLMRL